MTSESCKTGMKKIVLSECENKQKFEMATNYIHNLSIIKCRHQFQKFHVQCKNTKAQLPEQTVNYLMINFCKIFSGNF